MSRQSRLPRFIHYILAHGRGYFWLPCPICDRYFGGHENNPVGLKLTQHKSKMICRDPSCTAEARRLNKNFGIARPKAPENVTMIKIERRGNESLELPKEPIKEGDFGQITTGYCEVCGAGIGSIAGLKSHVCGELLPKKPKH